MTTPNDQPVNVARDDAHVGLQAGQAYIDTVTFPGDVQLTVGQDASPEAKYRPASKTSRAAIHAWHASSSGTP